MRMVSVPPDFLMVVLHWVYDANSLQHCRHQSTHSLHISMLQNNLEENTARTKSSVSVKNSPHSKAQRLLAEHRTY